MCLPCKCTSHIFNYREHNSSRAPANEIHQISPPLLPNNNCVWQEYYGHPLLEIALLSSPFSTHQSMTLPASLLSLSSALGIRFVLQSDSSPRLSCLPPHFFLPVVSLNEILGYLIPSWFLLLGRPRLMRKM